MKFITLLLCVTMCLLAMAENVWSHGVLGRVSSGKGILVEAEYDDGEPMSYAKVSISAPGAKLPFQSGRTDRNGRFCFFPDVQGDWKVVVDDEMGHRLEVNVPVDETLALQANQQREEAGESSLSRFQKALIGISTLFGISGILFWWRGKKGRNV